MTTSRRTFALAAVVAALTTAVGAIGSPARAGAGDGLVEVGVLEGTGEANGGPPHDPPPLLVAEEENLGFAIGVADSESRVTMYDLEELEEVTEAQSFEIDQLTPSQISAFGLDEDEGRLYFPNRPALGAGVVCPEESPSAFINDFSVLPTLEYDFDRAARAGSLQLERLYMPCAGNRAIANHALTVYEGTSGPKLLALGTYLDEGFRYPLPDADLIDNLGQSLIIRQFDLERLRRSTSPLNVDPNALEWEVDLRSSGCGRWDSLLVERVEDKVVTLCSDTRPVLKSSVGAQGYVVTIPLDGNDTPFTIDGAEPAPDPVNPANEAFILNAVIRRTPSLAGTVIPFVDPVSQRVLLLTADDANGNAVWVFNPKEERFIGVMTGGVVGQARDRTAAGFDPTNGRAYLLTERGILAALVRPSPLPGGRIYPVADGVHDEDGNLVDEERVTYPGITIGVAPKLKRLFVPIIGKGGWLVVEDRIPPPTRLAEADPDSFTTQVDEQEGVTDVNSSGAAIASGVHMINVGGAPRFANQLDPLCHSPHPATDVIHNNVNESDLFAGSCAADQIVTRGNRSVLVAPSTVTASLESEASAESSGLTFPERDQATDSDIKELGSCGYGYLERLQRPFTWMSEQDEDPDNDHSPQSPRSQDGGFCEQVQGGIRQGLGDDLRNGTRGGEYPEPGDGFPMRAASCSDFGSDPASDSFGEDEHDSPKDLVASATVTCDADAATASARSSAHGVAYPDAGAPIISVGRAWTATSTVKASEGQLTIATAVVEGVRVGPLNIGELRSVAVSKARGRTGTAAVEFSRVWCRVSLDGVDDMVPDTPAIGSPPDAPFDLPSPEDLDSIGGTATEDDDDSGDPTSGLTDGHVTEGCIDPDEDEPTRELLDELNQALGRIRFSVPPPEAEATDGGYQAVATKDPQVRAADQAVNDDDSHTVPALQAVIYNDGPEGRSRVVAQFAGVHTEARYGIVPLPDFDVPDFPDVELPPVLTDPFVPPSVLGSEARTIEDPVRIITIGNEPPDNPLAQFFNAPAQALQQLLSWLINNPLEAALLFMLLSLLASPIYLTLRARAAARALEPSEM